MKTIVSVKGQVVIPKEIRDALSIEASDVLVVSVDEDKIIMKPVPSVDDMYGAFSTNKPISKKEVKNVVGKAYVSKHEKRQ